MIETGPSSRFLSKLFPRGTRQLATLLLFCSLAALLGCGGGNSSSTGSSGSGGGTASISVSLSPSSTQSLHEGQTLNITATVANDSSGKGVTWTMTGPGSLTSQTTTSVTYNAGTNGTGSATVTATSVANSAESASLTIAVTAALALGPSSLPNGNVGTPYSQTLAVSNGTAPYTFSVSGSALPSGLSLNPLTATSGTIATISGQPTTQQSGVSFTIKVTDSSSPSQTASVNYTVSIGAETALTITGPSSLPGGEVNASYGSVAVTASGGIGPYTFSLDTNSVSLPAGLSLSAQGVISGTPTVTGTFTPIIVDVTDTTPTTVPSSSYTLTISACGSGQESLLNGQYVFLVTGFDNGTGGSETQPEPAFVGGVLAFNGVANNGAVTGQIDANLSGTGGVLNETITSGSYQVGADHRACVTITTSLATHSYIASLASISSGVASTGHMIDFDTNGPFTAGTLRKQNSPIPTSLSGSFAFGLSGPLNSAQLQIGGVKSGVVGQFTFTPGQSGSGTASGIFDENDAGGADGVVGGPWPTSGPFGTLSNGTYTLSSSTGRGTLTVTASSGGGSPSAAHFVLYAVSATDVLILDSDDQTTNETVAGEALQQSGSFSAGSLNGTFVSYLSGLTPTTPAKSTTLIAVSTANGSGTYTTQAYGNTGGTFAPATPTGSYSVDSTGRVLNNGGSGPLYYLVTENEGFVLAASTSVSSGRIEPQTSTAAPSGTFAFGTIDPQDSSVKLTSGLATFSGNPLAISLIADGNAAGQLFPNQMSQGSSSVSVDSTGFGTVSPNTSACTVGSGSNPCQFIFYVISANRAVWLNLTTGSGQAQDNPSLTIFDQ